jgi:hypothetical protein
MNQLHDLLTLRKNTTEVVVWLGETTPNRWRVYQWNDGQYMNWRVTEGRWFPSRFDALRFLRENGYVIAEEAR